MAVCGGTSHDAVVMADLIVCEIAGTADKQQAELLPDGQLGRYQWRTDKQLALKRRGRRRGEAGYSHGVGGVVGDVAGDCGGDHDRDDSEALVQRDGDAGTAVDGDRRRRAHADGGGNTSVGEGGHNRDAGDVVGDANAIVGGGRVKRRRIQRGIAAQHEVAEAGVGRDDVDYRRHGVEGI